MKRILSLITLTVLAAHIALGQEVTRSAADAKKGKIDEMGLYAPSEVKWKDGPGSLPAGAKFAVLEGDPAKDGPFVMRLWLPDGFKIPPHWHAKVERVTVISGVFNLGMGEKFDPSATREMPAGTFGFWPAGMRHFAWARGETVLQLHGTGPWTITYVNPADDPRNAKTEPAPARKQGASYH
ncbi:MAG: cupin domain-containing protein [Candidatus Hydrogenedentes bacterium]|nr:cupin domain-containing protein [Candidatus Hydrogenedentota bacterium]